LNIGKGIVQAQSGVQSQSGSSTTKSTQVQDQQKSAEVVAKVQEELPMTNTGGTAPYTSTDTYTPSSQAGTMSIQRDPYDDVQFNPSTNTSSAGGYGDDDSNITFE
jgi:hypothetical protein